MLEELSERGYTVKKVVRSTQECTKLVVDDQNSRYFVKCYPLRIIFRTTDSKKIINNELTMAENFKKMDLNTCVQFVKRVYTKTTLFIFFVFYRHITLEQLITNRTLSEQQIALILRDLLAIIYELRGAAVLHRHLSPDKILVTSNQLKFCSLKYCTDIRKTTYETDEYMYMLRNRTNLFCIAPEVLLNIFSGYKTQIFSFGVLTYLIIHKCYPYEKMQNEPGVQDYHQSSFKQAKDQESVQFKAGSKILDEYVSSATKLPKLHFHFDSSDRKGQQESTERIQGLSQIGKIDSYISPSKQVEYLKNYYAGGDAKPYVDPRLTQDLFYTLKNCLKTGYNDRMSLSEVKVTVGAIYKQIVQEEESIRTKLYNTMNPNIKVDDVTPSKEALKEQLFGYNSKPNVLMSHSKNLKRPMRLIPNLLSFKMEPTEGISKLEFESEKHHGSKLMASSTFRRQGESHLESLVNRTEKIFVRPVSLGILRRSHRAYENTSKPAQDSDLN